MQLPLLSYSQRTVSIFVFLISGIISYAQQPAPFKGINYQAVARDTSGNPLSNCPNLMVKFTIWDSIVAGNNIFTETHTAVSTNMYGLFTRVIGQVNTSGFDTIAWFTGNKFLEISIDSGGTGFVTMPRTQMVSVPYALHSNTANYSFANWSLIGNPTNNNTHFLGTTNSQDLIIKTNNTERMRIVSAGNVGIGTSAPTSPLTIKTLSTPARELEFVSTGANADIYANSQLNIESPNSVNLLTNGGTRLHVNNAGNIGIGTSTPGALLEVAGQVKITGGAPGAGKVLTSDPSGLATWTTLIQSSYTLGNGLSLTGTTVNSVWTQTGNDIFSNNSGKVGIGTTTPDSELEVVSTATTLPRGITLTQYHNLNDIDAQIWLRRARGTQNSPTAVMAEDEIGSIKFRGFDSNGFNINNQTDITALAAENFTSTANGSYLRFMTTPNGTTNGLERMRIASSGYVGIGTTSPNSELDVKGTIGITGSNTNELQRTQTGSANLVPIAYASVSSSGSLNTANTGNILVIWDIFNNHYIVKITGENYTTENYVTMVTIIGTNGKSEVDDDGNGNLIITIYAPANSKIQTDFQFVTFKP